MVKPVFLSLLCVVMSPLVQAASSSCALAVPDSPHKKKRYGNKRQRARQRKALLLKQQQAAAQKKRELEKEEQLQEAREQEERLKAEQLQIQQQQAELEKNLAALCDMKPTVMKAEHVYQIKHLLSLGVHPDMPNAVSLGQDIQRTPLGSAAWHGYLSIAQTLIDYGARRDMCVVDKERREAPLHLAARLAHIRYLSAHAKCGMNYPALIHLLCQGEGKSVINMGGTPEMPDTPLTLIAKQTFVAAEHKMTAMNYLFAHGASKKKRDALGRTALHVAASRGDLPLVCYLKLQGVPANTRKQNGESPFQTAKRIGRDDIADLLMPSPSASRVQSQMSAASSSSSSAGRSVRSKRGTRGRGRRGAPRRRLPRRRAIVLKK